MDKSERDSIYISGDLTGENAVALTSKGSESTVGKIDAVSAHAGRAKISDCGLDGLRMISEQSQNIDEGDIHLRCQCWSK